MLFVLDTNQHLFILILLLKQKINTLQTLSFQLIYLIVKNLKPCDIDHAVVVWWIWYLNTDTKCSDENWGKMCTFDKCKVNRVVFLSARHFFKNSVYHTDKWPDYIDLVHDAADKWVFTRQLKLILLQAWV